MSDKHPLEQQPQAQPMQNNVPTEITSANQNQTSEMGGVMPAQPQNPIVAANGGQGVAGNWDNQTQAKQHTIQQVSPNQKPPQKADDSHTFLWLSSVAVVIILILMAIAVLIIMKKKATLKNNNQHQQLRNQILGNAQSHHQSTNTLQNPMGGVRTTTQKSTPAPSGISTHTLPSKPLSRQGLSSQTQQNQIPQAVQKPSQPINPTMHTPTPYQIPPTVSQPNLGTPTQTPQAPVQVPTPMPPPAPILPLSEEDKEKSSVLLNSNALVVGASAIGNSHLAANPQIPCQDSHAISDLGGGWGIAVSCDGAGSYKRSHEGSRFAAEQLKDALSRAVAHFKWQEQNRLPDEYEWKDIAKSVFGLTYKKLVDYSNQLGLSDVEQLSCTAIVVVFSPIGLLVAHIGDGRACYQTTNGEWRAMIRPFAGDTGGTAFLPTDFVWKSLFKPMQSSQEQNDLIRTCLDVFVESRVINESVRSFALMSDGCEDYLYTTKQKYDSLGGKFLDINTPASDRLALLTTKLTEGIRQFDGKPDHQEFEVKNQLIRILRDEAGFKDEADDKTLVVGFFL